MWIKVIRYIFLGLGLYALIALLVMKFYKDDPSAMVWQDREAYNKRFIAQLHTDQHWKIEQVLDTLGTPDLTYVSQQNEDVYQIAYYRTKHVKSDGITTQDECTGLLFKNKQLIFWGKEAETAYLQADQ